jgi:hypothetical protein
MQALGPATLAERERVTCRYMFDAGQVTQGIEIFVDQCLVVHVRRKTDADKCKGVRLVETMMAIVTAICKAIRM